MTDTYTPGPWTVVERATRFAIKDVRRTIAYVQIAPRDAEHAALLAASPDLLNLARQYASECGECAGVGIKPDNEPCEECKFICAVIAKATEVQP